MCVCVCVYTIKNTLTHIHKHTNDNFLFLDFVFAYPVILIGTAADPLKCITVKIVSAHTNTHKHTHAHWIERYIECNNNDNHQKLRMQKIIMGTKRMSIQARLQMREKKKKTFENSKMNDNIFAI